METVIQYWLTLVNNRLIIVNIEALSKPNNSFRRFERKKDKEFIMENDKNDKIEQLNKEVIEIRKTLDDTNEILKKILNYLEKSNVSELIYHIRR